MIIETIISNLAQLKSHLDPYKDKSNFQDLFYNIYS